jgi:SAM-dependent methyltransferase
MSVGGIRRPATNDERAMKAQTDRLEGMKSGFGESDYYGFGLWLGIRNLIRNGFSLGIRKTIGKITQPINSYARFPEYFSMDRVIREYVNANSGEKRLRILDVGSPKCFGLYLAYTLPISIEMTDISELNVYEYKTMWRAIEGDARGTASFVLQDVRSLGYRTDSFDVVYSMSVVEHIEGLDAESRGIRELLRVLKPRGILLLSVPYGNQYVEQKRAGFAGAIRKTQDREFYFFQRIYDRDSLNDRIAGNLDGAEIKEKWTIWRCPHLASRIMNRMGENARGLLGFMNPWVSRKVNHSSQGIEEEVPSFYGEVHSSSDIYGDIVLVVQKAAASAGNGGVVEPVNAESRVDG